MSSIDQQFVEYVVKSLVGKPDAVQIERRIDEKGVLLELTVDPEDLGRVIGKRGATAQSLRTLLRALGTKNDARYNLKIVDNGVGGHHGEDHNSEHNDMPAPRGDVTHANTATAPPQASKEEATTVHMSARSGSDRIARTRKELEELNDLDL
jgi:predicted RNA-binding protein YlqC (UPF0109 family)